MNLSQFILVLGACLCAFLIGRLSAVAFTKPENDDE